MHSPYIKNLIIIFLFVGLNLYPFYGFTREVFLIIYLSVVSIFFTSCNNQ